MASPLDPNDPNHALGRLITVLICNAKCLQNMNRQANASASDDAMLISIDGLLASIVLVYKGDGYLLEQEAVALAASLGMQVTQEYITAHSQVTH